LSQPVIDGEGVQGRGPITICTADEGNKEREEDQRQLPKQAIAVTIIVVVATAAAGRHARHAWVCLGGAEQTLCGGERMEEGRQACFLSTHFVEDTKGLATPSGLKIKKITSPTLLDGRDVTSMSLKQRVQRYTRGWTRTESHIDTAAAVWKPAPRVWRILLPFEVRRAAPPLEVMRVAGDVDSG
jgi:hypothetical protein